MRRYLDKSKVSVDPFCGEKRWATFNNDLAHGGTDAEEFCKSLYADHAGTVDLVLFDPPYSPRQISECYKSIGLTVDMKTTQSALLYQRVRNAIIPCLTNDAIVLSFGWNCQGMGKRLNFEQMEILICDHGGAHNATLCLAEKRIT